MIMYCYIIEKFGLCSMGHKIKTLYKGLVDHCSQALAKLSAIHRNNVLPFVNMLKFHVEWYLH